MKTMVCKKCGNVFRNVWFQGEDNQIISFDLTCDRSSLSVYGDKVSCSCGGECVDVYKRKIK
jgi:hypothetical protein